MVIDIQNIDLLVARLEALGYYRDIHYSLEELQ